MDWATPEFSGPTTPRTVLVAGELGGVLLAGGGLGLVVEGLDLERDAGDVFFLLASSTASWAPYWMPRPVAESSPVSGASTPMVTVVPSPVAAAVAAVVVAGAAGGEREGSRREHGGEYEQGT